MTTVEGVGRVPQGYVAPSSWERAADHAEAALLDALADARVRHGREIEDRAIRERHGIIPGPDAVDFEGEIARQRSRVRDLVAALRVQHAGRAQYGVRNGDGSGDWPVPAWATSRTDPLRWAQTVAEAEGGTVIVRRQVQYKSPWRPL